MSSEKNTSRRTYRKRLRADHEAATRLAITEAAMRLHGTVGPAQTTIKGVAAEAGVQRATVYRHFPDSESLFTACSAHWASLNPPPDPASWQKIGDPEDRLRQALAELYEWYEWAEPMLTNVFRDAPLVPEMNGPIERSERQFAELHAALMTGRRVRGRARDTVAAAIGHALEFGTWRSLRRAQRLESEQAAELMVALVDAASRSRTRRTERGARRAA